MQHYVNLCYWVTVVKCNSKFTQAHYLTTNVARIISVWWHFKLIHCWISGILFLKAKKFCMFCYSMLHRCKLPVKQETKVNSITQLTTVWKSYYGRHWSITNISGMVSHLQGQCFMLCSLNLKKKIVFYADTLLILPMQQIRILPVFRSYPTRHQVSRRDGHLFLQLLSYGTHYSNLIKNYITVIALFYLILVGC